MYDDDDNQNLISYNNKVFFLKLNLKSYWHHGCCQYEEEGNLVDREIH